MSVRKRTWTTEGGETRSAYLVQYSTSEKDDRGKRRRHIKTFNTKKEAMAFEAQVRVDIGEGVHVPASKSITVAEAGRKWIDSCADLERTTLDGYKQHLRDHINPYLGGVKLPLTVPIVKDWQVKLRKGVPAPDEMSGKDVEHVTGPRSANMIKRVTRSLGALIDEAQDVGANPVRSLNAKRKSKKERKAERRAKGKLKVGVNIPTTQEIDALLRAATGRWRPFLLVAIRCGLRASELRGLRWDDVDFKKSELHVRQRADAYNTIGMPKSEDGERTIPIPPKTLQALREWKVACPRRGGELHYVFPNGQGNIENHTNIITRGLLPTWEATGVVVPAKDAEGKFRRYGKGKTVVAKYTGLHSLRHFFASWCVNRRADGGLELPAKIVQERLGHANIGITLDLYSHLFPRVDDKAELAAGEGKFG
jgi:integrase